jgi:perosamine synthetase
MKKIIQIEPWIGDKEANNINKIVKKTFLTESHETKKFENSFVKKFGATYAIAVSNWTNGLFMALKAFNIGKGDEVIVPNLTFIATINSVIMSGATPVVCEVEEKTLSLNLKNLKKFINKKTKAVIPVHLYGHCCNLSELKKICKQKKIAIIEDAAQSIGAKYKKSFLGTIGDIGGYSFYGNKIITTGEGGIVLTNNKRLNKKMYQLKNHGRDIKGIFKHKTIGYNFMFTELQAAIGNIQLKKLSKILNKKKKLFLRYKKEFSQIKQIKFMKNIEDNKPVYWFSNIFLREKKNLKKFLEKKNIQTRDIFYPINLQPCYQKNNFVKFPEKNYNVSKKIYDTGISLPSSFSLKLEDQDYIINNVKKFFQI